MQQQPKSPAVIKTELRSKIKSVKDRLAEIRQYKQVLAADGLKPDADDKALESELIVKLLRLERQLDEMEGRRPKRNLPQPRPPEAKGATGRRGRQGQKVQKRSPAKPGKKPQGSKPRRP